MNHTISGRDYQNLWFNGIARRRDRDQRGALRELGLPGSARDRRRGDAAPRREELLGEGLTTVP